jgi:hypothetical protein
MNRTTTKATTLLLVTVVGLAVVLAGCGIADDDGRTTAKAQGATSDGAPAMREPRSMCERVPLATVEGATRMQLDPGNPSEADGEECSWRKPGGDEAVTLTLQEGVSLDQHLEAMKSRTAVEVAGIGEHAYSTDLMEVFALTDEGEYRTHILNFDVSDSVIVEAGVTLIRTAMENTEVPDTTTTTSPTPEPSEQTGLCTRVSIKTVEAASHTLVEPGVVKDTAVNRTRSCTFRERTAGPVVELELVEGRDLSITDGETIYIDGTAGELVLSAFTLYVEDPEGLLTVRLSNYELTDEQARAGLITIAQEYLASA